MVQTMLAFFRGAGKVQRAGRKRRRLASAAVLFPAIIAAGLLYFFAVLKQADTRDEVERPAFSPVALSFAFRSLFPHKKFHTSSFPAASATHGAGLDGRHAAVSSGNDGDAATASATGNSGDENNGLSVSGQPSSSAADAPAAPLPALLSSHLSPARFLATALLLLRYSLHGREAPQAAGSVPPPLPVQSTTATSADTARSTGILPGRLLLPHAAVHNDPSAHLLALSRGLAILRLLRQAGWNDSRPLPLLRMAPARGECRATSEPGMGFWMEGPQRSEGGGGGGEAQEAEGEQGQELQPAASGPRAQVAGRRLLGDGGGEGRGMSGRQRGASNLGGMAPTGRGARAEGKKVEEERENGRPRRQFLMLVLTWEQLSQARLHMMEAVLLAKRLNRTLVLTNVGGSMIHYLRQRPFCTYFDTGAVGRAVPWVTQQWLNDEMIARRHVVSTHTVLIVRPKLVCNREVLRGYGVPNTIYSRDVDELWLHQKGKLQLAPGYSGANNSSSSRGYRPRIECVKTRRKTTREQRQRMLMAAVGREHARRADLLLLGKVWHQYFFPLQELEAVSGSLRYAPHLHRMAEAFAARHLRPGFVALHLRMEFILRDLSSGGKGGGRGSSGNFLHEDAEEALRECADGMLRDAKCRVLAMLAGAGGEAPRAIGGMQCDRTTVEAEWAALQAASPAQPPFSLRPVFLAADLSLSRNYSKSLDFLQPGTAEGAAFVAARQQLQRVLRELRPVTWPTHEAEFDRLDRGEQGILDKLVLQKAGFFLAAPRECGGGHTYSREVHLARTEQGLPSDTWEVMVE